MKSAEYVADRLCMLDDGNIIFDGTFADIQASPDPIVRQFITGSSQGPLTDDAPQKFERRRLFNRRRGETA